jgi:hypothetical protein
MVPDLISKYIVLRIYPVVNLAANFFVGGAVIFYNSFSKIETIERDYSMLKLKSTPGNVTEVTSAGNNFVSGETISNNIFF